MWFRVFGTNEVQPGPAQLMEHLQGLAGNKGQGKFTGDDRGWFRAEFTLVRGAKPIVLERFLVEEEAIRDELNAWAAWLETAEHCPNSQRLMQQVINTRQLFTLQPPLDPVLENPVEEACLGICRYLSRETGGVYQVDNKGFFSSDGMLVVKE